MGKHEAGHKTQPDKYTQSLAHSQLNSKSINHVL